MEPIVNLELYEKLRKEILNGKIIEDKEKFCIANVFKCTIAHEQAWYFSHFFLAPRN